MATRRYTTVSTPTCSPRISVDNSLHPTVDKIIKDLKICTRRFQAALSSHEVELRILERLHYKGNHQHRTALFWRRVVDIRRCGRRIAEVRADELVSKIRLSFWGDVSQNPKALKGSWTHVPDSKTVLSVLQRVSAYRALIHHSQERLVMAQTQFSLDLQTGAFLQLMLVLTAVASRLHILLEEIGSAADQCSDACMRLLGVLDPSHVCFSGSTSTPGIMPESVISVPSSVPSVVDDVDEDGALSELPSEHQPDHIEEIAPVNNPDSLNFLFSSKTEPDLQATVVRSTVKRTAIAEVDTLMKRKHELSEPRVPKKRKKKDEIDDIFGF